ncbi:putative NADPH-dependent FMN reductase-containing protein [Homarus americanus]|uniref:Putative NADPH-dependent FMN reductase-containing protein n=1 Tax=Homarus americanus TaxID=6706 RepID=A0A8J5JRV2_HOMAM|nr:putative NADPH-dependent FMN reductase-containing protein [Homarus americanus]
MHPLTLGSNGHVSQPLHFYKDQSQAPEWMIKTNAKIQAANGLIIVTPEYNCMLPPGLTSMMDQFPPASYRYKPCGIVCYSMGEVHLVDYEQLLFRPFLSELGLVTTPQVCVIPHVQGKFNDEGECQDERVKKNMEKVIDEIQWYGSAIMDKIKADGLPS